MKVSIITIVYNCSDCIEKTIRSVINQNYSDLEFIIVDGGSVDGTVEIIKSYERAIDKWVTEPDDGIYDAMNKGLNMAEGDFIQFIHADDWLSEDQVKKAVEVLEKNPEYDFVFGDLNLYDKNGRAVCRVVGDIDYHKTIKFKMPVVNHPTVMFRRRLYEKIGGFSNYKVAMDYDWFLRCYISGLKGIYSSDILGNMSMGGVSYSQVFQGLDEVKQISEMLAGKSFMTTYWHYVYKTKIYIKIILKYIFSEKFVFELRKLLFRKTYSSVSKDVQID